MISQRLVSLGLMAGVMGVILLVAALTPRRPPLRDAGVLDMGPGCVYVLDGEVYHWPKVTPADVCDSPAAARAAVRLERLFTARRADLLAEISALLAQEWGPE